MRTFLIAATLLAGVTLSSVALAAEPPAPKAGAKPEARKETRSDPCEAEAPKKAGTPAKKPPAVQKSGAKEPTKR